MTGPYTSAVAADSPSATFLGTALTGGTATATVPTLDTGDRGQAYDGATQSFATGSSGTPNGTGPWSIECWVIPQTNGTVGAVVGSGDMLLQTFPSGGGVYQMSLQIAGVYSTAPNLPLKNGQWNHVVVTYDGTSLFLWVNGVRGSSVNNHGWTPACTTPLLVGAQGTGTTPTRWFAGSVADVSFYNHPLPAESIIAHFGNRAGAPTYPAASTFTGDYYPLIMADGPLAFYRTDETAGALAIDRSGNGNHGAYGLGQYSLIVAGATYDGDKAALLNESWSAGVYDPYFAGIATPFTALSGTTQMSVEAWIFPTSIHTTGNQVTVIAGSCNNFSTSDAGGFCFYVDGSHRLVCSVNQGISIVHAQGGTVPAGQWSHCVATFDGASVKVYLNGVQVGGATLSGTMSSFATNIGFGYLPIVSSDNGQYQGTLDEAGLYNYPLTATQVLLHYNTGLGPIPPPPVTYTVGDDRHYWEVEVYDRHGVLLDLPKGDIEAADVTDVINGGSSDGSITFARGFNSIGQIAYLNRVLIRAWHGRIPRPLNPTWSGYMGDIDQERTTTLGKITAHLTGDANHLNRGLVSEQVNPGAAYGNPNLDAADYIKYLFSTYGPPGYMNLVCPPTLFPLMQMQFTRQKLASVLDTVIKTGRDSLGNFITWRVSSDYMLRRTLTVQSDQNPNTVTSVKFKHLFVKAQCSKYTINTKYRDIVNVVLVEGGKDPYTGQTVAAVFEDSGSLTSFDPWEDAISVPALVTADACNAYGEVYLDLYANPQAQGEIELHYPDPTILAGTWVQTWELASVIKQLRIASVRFQLSPTRVTQTLSPVAPTPYLDEAVYRMGLNSQKAATQTVAALPVNTQNNFVRLGGVTTAGP